MSGSVACKILCTDKSSLKRFQKVEYINRGNVPEQSLTLSFVFSF